MAFWSAWFAPTCESCGQKMVEVEPVLDGDRKLCPTCHAALMAKRQAEIDARRAEEDAARQRLEQGRQFGVDPRSKA